MENHDVTEKNDCTGLGKVVYSVDEEKTEKAQREERAAEAEVAEADQESFPASDPPGYVGGAKHEPKVESS
jgi:hypothetical protein